ncbi:MAG: GNAT family N-acetyltransferase [Syntrophales bacterium]|jgi:acyl-CoA synthetase (NDP forming)|nr:GNAT family N-acetyltransferase [Syntrophales bacterium]MDY0044764.1 GNAT family N-acetyltransferase [Syntrophales bacterium]
MASGDMIKKLQGAKICVFSAEKKKRVDIGETEREILCRAIHENRSYLMENECKEILEGLGITTTGFLVAATEDDAVAISRRIGYPVVLKILSPDVIHKSDAGGVRLNLTGDEAVRAAYRQMIENFRFRHIIGVSVQKMAEQGLEAIVGVIRDPSFGPVLMFGLGGIFVEVLRDVSFRVLPVNEKDADEMIKEIKGYGLLKGYRGHCADINALIDLLCKISLLVTSHPEIRELDLNPVLLYPKGYMVADARIFVEEVSAKRSKEREKKDLHDFFYPESIAVIGATDSKNKLGHNVFHNLVSHDFKGKLYPVNPAKQSILGYTAYPSIKEVKNSIDVAIIIVPVKAAIKAVEDCCAKGVSYIIMETAGFAETGEEGKKVQSQIEEIIRTKECRILGPNCSGIINTHHNMVQSLGILEDLKKGNIGLIAQAGVYAAGILTGLRHIINFGIVATIGNKMDINETDILEYLGEDKNIGVIGMYMEDVKSGKRFLEVASRVAVKKPVIVLKAGKTEAGRKAVSSHTASLAGNEEINGAAFKQSGLIRARDNEHLFSLLRAFSKQPLPRSNGVMVITYTGSLGVAATDMMYLNNLRLGALEPYLRNKLKNVLPSYLNIGNPVDCSFSMDPEQVKTLIEIGIESAEIDSFIVIIQGEMLASFVDTLKSINYKGKPIVCCVACKEFMMDNVIKMEQNGIPVYSTSEMAAEVLGEMYRYGQRQRKTLSDSIASNLHDDAIVIDNTLLRLRLINQSDIQSWTDFVNSCSPQSLWMRFLSPFIPTPQRAEKFCNVDPNHEIAVVAEMTKDDHKKLVGIARLLKDVHRHEADYALIISDPWQKKMLGCLMSERCIELAKNWGVKKIKAETIQQNFPMLRVLKHCNFALEHKDGNMIFMSRDLQ